MDAYKLADELKSCLDDGSTDLVCVHNATNMLRQQADRIAELEKEIKQWGKIDTWWNKNAEPVAWATEDFEEIMTPELRQKHIDHPKSCTHKFFPIPLYTTPQTKPLSDEEIEEIAIKCDNFNSKNVMQYPDELNVKMFARAIEERILGK